MPRSFRSQRPVLPLPPHREIFVGEAKTTNESDIDLVRKAMFDRIAAEMRLGQPLRSFEEILGAEAYAAALTVDAETRPEVD